MDASGIRKLESAKRLQTEAYRAWFVGLMCNTIAGFYTLWRLKERERRVDKNEGEGVVEGKKIVRYVLAPRLRMMIRCSGADVMQGTRCGQSSARLRSLRFDDTGFSYWLCESG